ncbi:hypothetical protein DCAR_0833006 [Daucus carota subsp. sativus]|uniref:Organ specific protein n=1 Tax=Daucus carota subsp. sativus TaxID=79200 RepID=A0AAF0XSG4_DAUCS|nr:hypothetical protein DCAR_0833006 [Daucus carota subsp. sativus]
MKLSTFFFIFFVLFAFVGFVRARKDPQDYWNKVMNGKPMPQSIKDLYSQSNFKDFDTRPSPYMNCDSLRHKKMEAVDAKIKNP